ncbi:YoaK family protein, partial [Acetobacter oeni]
RVGKRRSFGADWKLGCTLASVAGAVNAAGFMAVGYYSANMTGNLSTLTMALHQHDVAVIGTGIGLIFCFVCGASLATILVNAGRRRRLVSVYAWSILLEAGLLAALGLDDIFLPGVLREAVLAYGLSFLMGLQNATVTRISDARVRTTHMTGMLTDIGIGIVDSFGGDEAARKTRKRLLLHTSVVMSFALGGTAGAFLYGSMGGRCLLAFAVVLAVVSVQGIRGRRQTADL